VKAPMRMKDKIILRVVSKALLPPILLFALYVQFHGDFGPGGGFQAGVIFAAGLVLFGLIFGLDALKQVFPVVWVEVGVSLGVLLYAGVGVVSMLCGYDFLDYDALHVPGPMHGQHLGIFLVELGVGITVTCAMTAIFYFFAGRRAS